MSAARFPDKPFIIFYDTAIGYRRFKEETEKVAGWLQQVCGVKKGDRVLLYMQNSPQFMTAFYGILRADAVVVPVNPMNLTNELRHYMTDSGAKVAFAAQELYPRIQPLLGDGLDTIVVASYSDYLEQPTDLHVPDFVKAPRMAVKDKGAVAWAEVLAAGAKPAAMQAGADDLAVMPYTSGTTGQPKGCMHSHRTTMYNAVAGGVWTQATGGVGLAVLPMFHVTGMQYNLNGAIYNSGTVVLLPRWDRDAAALCVQRYGVTGMALITAMVIDFMANPKLDEYDLSQPAQRRRRRRGDAQGGGARAGTEAGPEVPRGLRHVGNDGRRRTPTRPSGRRSSAWASRSSTWTRAWSSPAARAELPPGQTGEIIVHGPQVMQGYWNQPEATGRGLRRDRRQAVPAHRRPRRTWTRRATSSSSTGSSG